MNHRPPSFEPLDPRRLFSYAPLAAGFGAGGQLDLAPGVGFGGEQAFA